MIFIYPIVFHEISHETSMYPWHPIVFHEISHEIPINPAFFLLYRPMVYLISPMEDQPMISHLALRGDQQIFPGVPGRRNTMRIQNGYGREKILEKRPEMSFLYTNIYYITLNWKGFQSWIMLILKSLGSRTPIIINQQGFWALLIWPTLDITERIC